MLEWIPRGLRKGRITTGYPRRPEPPPTGFQGPIEVLDTRAAGNRLVELCPTGAIAVDETGSLSVHHGRCIGCGACVRAAPRQFAFAQRYETGSPARELLVDRGPLEPGGPAVGSANLPLGMQARALRRSIHVRHVDAGSDGSEEWEIQALWNPYYDIQRLGFFLTSSPRHADILIVTGGVTQPMRGPLERTWEVMPAPKALIAAGTDACSGGLAAATGLCAGGVNQVLPVDIYVPGSPPSPIALLDGLLQAVGLLRAQEAA
jgi:Ni,Fe-hydrogenase III small subunit/NAD-dependent dihydropyrimidine dehydrogenase PreA subunit